MLKRKILIVDDDVISVTLISELVKRLGFDFSCAFSGEEAMKIIDNSFDIVITDMHMFKISGNDVARYAKEINSFARVILCYYPMHIKPEFELFDNIIMKPIEFNELIAAIS